MVGESSVARNNNSHGTKESQRTENADHHTDNTKSQDILSYKFRGGEADFSDEQSCSSYKNFLSSLMLPYNKDTSLPSQFKIPRSKGFWKGIIGLSRTYLSVDHDLMNEVSRGLFIGFLALLLWSAVMVGHHLANKRYCRDTVLQPLTWDNPDYERIWNMFWGQRENNIGSYMKNGSEKPNDADSVSSLTRKQSVSAGRLSSRRTLLGTKGKSTTGAKLVIAGRMTLDDGPCNIAQLTLQSGEWSLTERIQLNLYNSYTGGEVYSLLANHTFSSDIDGEDEGHMATLDNQRPRIKREDLRQGEELIVVGAFDTTYRNSQVTYCSVGAWDGRKLSKVGEGLCNSALSKGMKITTAALAGPQDVYVAGSFNTQVWNGDRHEFVKIFNIAHYNAVDQVWLPLPIGQITCSWCTVTVLALAWDSVRGNLHVAGKFNAIDGRNIPSGLAIYSPKIGRLVAHPGGGLTMFNRTQDGVGTALQLDEEAGVLYVMGSYERVGGGQICSGLAAYEITTNHWTCLADAAHSVLPSGGGNMLLTPYGLMVAGRTTASTTWPDSSRPYTIALLKATPKEIKSKKASKKPTDEDTIIDNALGTEPGHDYEWSWLPGFEGHTEPLHTLANGFGEYEGKVFIGGDNLVATWYYEERSEDAKSSSSNGSSGRSLSTSGTTSDTFYVPVTVPLSQNHVRGAIMAIAQLAEGKDTSSLPERNFVGYTIAVYFIALGALLGMFLALLCNRSLNQTLLSFFAKEANAAGISLDTLTYSAVENTNVAEAYQRAMRLRFIHQPHLLTLIDPQEIILHRIIGEGTFGRVWSAKWRSASVAVKEFVFAQAAVAGRSTQQREIIEEIIGEAGMMAILRHPNVLQLFGCSLTAQAIWIVSELCSLGSLRQLLDDKDRDLSMVVRLKIALQVAEGMMYLHNQDPPIIHRDLKSHNIFVHETFTETTDAEMSPKQTYWQKRDTVDSSQSTGNGDFPYRFDQSDKSGKMNSEATIIAKIGDWGSARATLSGSRTMTHGVGTACWLAPEVIKYARSSKYSDVYGYGIILWELATREEVYAGLESTQIIANVANDNLRPPIVHDCPWTQMMVKCWCENPSDRLSFEEIVKDLNILLQETLENERSSSDTIEDNSISHISYQNQHVVAKV